MSLFSEKPLTLGFHFKPDIDSIWLGMASHRWEKTMAPHSSTLAWKIPWTEESGGLQSWGCDESDKTDWHNFHFSHSSIGEGNGNPLRVLAWRIPGTGGAWWAAVHGVTQSRTWLKWLSSSSSSSHRWACRINWEWLAQNMWNVYQK